jgi:hypothetical protein
VAACGQLEAVFVGKIFAIKGNGRVEFFVPNVTDTLEE